MKYVLTIILLMSTQLVYSGTTSIPVVTGLTDEQKANLTLQATKMVTANKAIPKTVVPKASEVKEWAALINVVGDGMVTIAKKTGMAVNDFANSKVGIFTMIIIGWNYLGHDFTSFIFGMMWLTFTVPMWLYCYRRMFLISKIIIYDKNQTNGKCKEVIFENNNCDSNGHIAMMYWFTLMISCAVGIVAVLA